MVNSAPVTPNSSASRDKSIENIYGNNIASYSYNTTGTGENEKINGTQGTVPRARMRDIAQIKIVTRIEMSKTPSEYRKSYL